MGGVNSVSSDPSLLSLNPGATTMPDVIQPGFYIFMNERGGTSIDVLPGNVIAGCPRDDSRETQKWQVESSGQGYTIRNVSTRLYMTATPYDRYHVMVSSTVRKWTFETDWRGGPNLTIGLVGSGFILDLSDYGSPTPGQPVLLAPRRNHREPCQFWTLIPVQQKVCITHYTSTSSQEF
ncbi:hypothetical protein BJV74DRAFT_851266 [Russula compacta]|nr:hypothetical protein BJV74DRAFT_851266 [Russula compacta]